MDRPVWPTVRQGGWRTDTDPQVDFSMEMAYNKAKKVNKTSLTRKEGRRAGMQVNILEAKTEFSKLIRLLETGKEDHIVVARYGKPVVKMTVYNDVPVSRRIGVAKGKLRSPDDLDQFNDEIAELFGGTAL